MVFNEARILGWLMARRSIRLLTAGKERRMKVRFRDLQEKYGSFCIMFDIVPLHYIDKWGDDIELKIDDVFDVSYYYPDFIEVLN